MNKTTAIEYLESQGFVGDYDLASCVTNFFGYLGAREDEEKDTYLRAVNFHSSRILTRLSEGKTLEFLSKTNGKMRANTSNKPVSLQWFSYDSQKDIPIERVVKEYSLNKKESEFLEAIHFKSLRIGVAIALIDELMEGLGYNPDSNL